GGWPLDAGGFRKALKFNPTRARYRGPFRSLSVQVTTSNARAIPDAMRVERFIGLLDDNRARHQCAMHTALVRVSPRCREVPLNIPLDCCGESLGSEPA